MMNRITDTTEQRLTSIPINLQIQILYDCPHFVVINKPSNLRSVPGHANPPPSTSAGNKRPRSAQREGQGNSAGEEKRTAQEAWVMAVKSFDRNHDTETSSTMPCNDNVDIHQTSLRCLQRLASSANSKMIESVPRKLKIFRRFVERNQNTLFLFEDNQKQEQRDRIDLDKLSQYMHRMIQKRQKALMNLPEPTKHEESAYGQLILYRGYKDDGTGRRFDNDDDNNNDNNGSEQAHMNTSNDTSSCPYEQQQQHFSVVHRLDCEVRI